MTANLSDEELMRWAEKALKHIGCDHYDGHQYFYGGISAVPLVKQLSARLSSLLRERDSAIAERDRMRSALDTIAHSEFEMSLSEYEEFVRETAIAALQQKKNNG